jgi:hypothetical protein
MPGSYRVAINVPGVSTALRGDVMVQSDPMDRAFTTTARQARQDALMSLYDLQKRLGAARGRVQPEADDTDAAKQQSTRIQAELDRIVGVAGSLLRSIESFNSVPTADHRQQMTWANGDAQRAFAAIDALRRNAP